MTSEYSEAHKIPAYELVVLTNKDAQFYELVGPFLSRREIVSEIGNNVWDDDDKHWVAAISEDRVLGICATRKNEACSFYVEPGSRGMSIGFALLRKLLAEFPETNKVTCNENSQELFKLFGFSQSGNRGKFTLMKRVNDV
jgi:GNAT superfamily N-acetyltransferase